MHFGYSFFAVEEPLQVGDYEGCRFISRELNIPIILDENFLLYKKRALRLLELMEQHDKSWAFYIFSSGRVLESYTMEQLVRVARSLREEHKFGGYIHLKAIAGAEEALLAQAGAYADQ